MIYVFAEFEKCGILRYISHLDLQRAMTRLLLRTDLPIVFSEGFNPHPKLTFAQPLSIFQESVCEIAVFRLSDPPSEEETLRKLREAASEGLNFRKVSYSEKKLPECRAARYEILLETQMTAEELKAATDGPMPVLKKSKAKTETVDISPMIRERVWEKREEGVLLTCVLPAGNSTLNPSYIGTFLEGKARVRRILRTELLF